MHSKDNLKGKFPTNEMIRLFGYKFLYYTIMLIIPLLVIDLAWYYILLGFVALHLVEGITLTIIFQLAHVVEGTDFPVPDPGGNIENSWAVHQVYTTADFAIDDPVVCYLFGGLNFQIEHHLFPKICHVHYPKIAPIVEQTAKEFGFPYINNKTLGSALKSHIRLMRDFGKGVK